MKYRDITIQKTVQESHGDQFNVDWDSSQGRCPDCNELVTVPVNRPFFYRVNKIDNSVNIAAPKEFILIAPDTTTRVHLTFMALSESALIFRFYRNVTTSADGSQINPDANDRNNDIEPELLVYQNPTVDTTGTQIYNKRIPAGQSGAYITRDITPESEIILRQGIKYLLRIIPGVDSSAISTGISWFEVK